MSRVEAAFCRSALWRAFTGRVVLPWLLGGTDLDGEVLEIGSGPGANAQALLDREPSLTLTATDVDPDMVQRARGRLAAYGGRVTVAEADATQLSFESGRFDAALSLLMLHHVVEWRAALAEINRVLRPGGTLVGYDLTNRRTARLIHLVDRSPHRLIAPDELHDGLLRAGFEEIETATGLGATVMRFRATAPG